MKKIACFFLSLLLLFFCMTGCQKKRSENENGLKPVTLKMYLVGDSVADYPLMLEALNKIMQEDINAKLEVNFTTWVDWKTKLRLLLSSGEKIDLVHMAPWSIYNEQAKQGAFLPLDDLAPKYAPETWQSYSQEVKKQAMVDGKVYMLPFNFSDPYGNGFVYRLDLAEKHGLGQIKTINDLINYLKVIKENEDMIPYNAGEFDLQLIGETMHTAVSSYKQVAREPILTAQYEYFHVFHDDPDHPQFFFEQPYFKQAAQLARKFYLDNYLLKNVLTNKVGSRESFIAGKSALTILNPLNANEEYLKLKDKGWKLGWWIPFQNHKSFIKHPANNNGMAIPVSSENPERAMMLLEKLHQDQRYHDLTTYGIKGKHWQLDSNGDIILPNGLNSANSGFAWDKPCPWGWREDKFYRISPIKSSKAWPQIKEWLEYFAKYGKDRKYTDFTFDKAPVNSQLAAMDTVAVQYARPLEWGVVETEEGYARMMDRFKKAGLEDVRAELIKQWKSYLKK